MKKAFTLIELMIVIAIIAIIAAIAIPNLIEARKQGNEAAAIGALRTLNTAQSIYRESGKEVVSGASQYADNLAELSATGTDLVDDVLGTSSKQGFNFLISADAAGYNWDGQANAATTNTGNRKFYTNQSGVIYFSTNAPTTAAALTGGTGNVPANFNALGG